MNTQFFATWMGHGQHFGGRGERGEGNSDRHGRHCGPDFGEADSNTRGFGGRGFGRGFGHRGFWGNFGGGGRERLFDGGDIKLVILKLLSEQPSYGYQLMKTMEERLAGGYTPSAGVIYPTLTMLEEEGLIVAATSEGPKKVYSVTPQGLEFLEANKERLGGLFARLEEAKEEFQRGRSPELMKAFMNLRSAIGARLVRGAITPEQIQKLAEIVNQAAKSIDEL